VSRRSYHQQRIREGTLDPPDRPPRWQPDPDDIAVQIAVLYLDQGGSVNGAARASGLSAYKCAVIRDILEIPGVQAGTRREGERFVAGLG
jgi:hypothetical protein